MLTKLHFKIELLWLYFKKHWIISSFFFLGLISTIIFRQQLISLYNLPIFHPQIIGIEGRYTIDDLPDEISQKISLGLAIFSDNQKPELSKLVKSLEIQNDNKDYVFTLNDNVYWSSGKKFTAYDINYQITGLTITPLSNYSVKISSETKFSPLLASLSQPLIKSNFDGLGDYTVTKITYQEGYIKTINLKPKDNHKNSIEYHFYFDQQDVINAYKIGNVDIIQINSLPPELSNWGKTKIIKEIKTDEKYVALFINTQKISSKQIRQALAYATPKGEKNQRCLGPISPNSWAYFPNVKEYSLNRSRAKELLGEEKIEKINLSINDRNLLPLAEEIKTAWQNTLGFPVSVTIENQINFDNYDTLLTYGAITNDPDQYLFWHSTQTNTNITKLNNPRIDKILEEGRQLTDQIERKALYQDFQTYLLEESPAIFLYYPTVYTITRSK
ncbi:MAG: ABC transporter substrate-binding protein [Candidatus Shapirobacteria bacterium]|nr:ABC transporter substrate-binding protein [Candidatus Shapirobacteria bacterium]